MGPLGNLLFIEQMAKLLFSNAPEHLAGLQTPGGCGALRVLAELIMKTGRTLTLWASNPTWANHVPLLAGAGLNIQSYRYYDYKNHGLDFDGMMCDLDNAQAGDVVLLHGCCHNPSGADLNQKQWPLLLELCANKSLVPLIDVAYQGFGDDLEQDAFGVRLAAKMLPEFMLAVSCSKNFGLYRERVGAAFVVSESAEAKAASISHMAAVTRGIYSMPPSHGASVVAEILSDDVLRAQWQSELSGMCFRIKSLRSDLAAALAEASGHRDFSFIEEEKGMFSFLGLNPEQVKRLADEHAIYMADSSRINLAGLNSSNLAHVVNSVKSIL